jgi:hypothetical protein
MADPLPVSNVPSGLPHEWHALARSLEARAADEAQDEYARRFASELLTLLPSIAKAAESGISPVLARAFRS